MPVADLAAPDSALFLWATFPQLPEALRLIEAWGFTYKSVAFVWLKKNKKADSWFYGLGFWTRGNAEICLLATKGHPKRQAANIHQFIISPIEAHSKKPDEARAKIISLMGDLPRVELFARQTPPGWAVWGNEVTPTIPDFGTHCLEVQKSNNGIERSKYITFGIPAEGIAEARPRLERVEADVMGNFKRLGVPSEPMDGRARLALLHSQMHPGSREAFRFSWKDIPQTGLGTKDFIAPDSLDFRQSRTFRIGQYWGTVSYLQIMASELSDKLLAEILELDAEMTVTMHIQTVDQLKAIKTIKGKISDIGKMKVEEQRKAVRSGYDPDILPPDLITFSKDAAELFRLSAGLRYGGLPGNGR